MRSLLNFIFKLWSKFLILWPRPWLRAIGGLLGFLWIDLFKFRKKIVMSNLNIAFPGMSEEEKQQLARESVYNLGYNFAEFFVLPSVTPEWVDKNVVFEGIEHCRQAQDENKGVFFLSMHIGHSDMAANAIALKVMPIYIITKVFKNKLFNDLWFSIRGAQGVRYIDAHGPTNAFEILKALKQKSAVTFVLDQFMGRPYGIPTKFFGKRTGTAYGLALFVLKTGAPVVPVYPYEGRDGKIHVVFLPKLDMAPFINDNKDESIQKMTQHFTDVIEQCVSKHPDQWMWVHRRWKDIE